MPAHLCHIDELPQSGARGFDPRGAGRDTLFVVRKGPLLRAWRNACPHIDGAPMAWKKDAYLSADGSSIMCYAHGATFDIATGVCLRGPCEGRALTPIPLVVEPDGRLRIDNILETEP